MYCWDLFLVLLLSASSAALVNFRFSNAENAAADTNVKIDDTSDVNLQKKCRQLERLNGRLKEIVRSNLAAEMSPKDFSQLSCQQIVQFVAKKKQRQADESTILQFLTFKGQRIGKWVG